MRYLSPAIAILFAGCATTTRTVIENDSAAMVAAADASKLVLVTIMAGAAFAAVVWAIAWCAVESKRTW